MSGIVTATSAALVGTAATAGGAAATAGLIGTAGSLTAAGVIGGLGTVASLGSAAYSLLSKPKQADGTAAENQVDTSEANAMSARSQLLETAGGAAGSPLAPGEVQKNPNTIFGN